jgi:hypothetical protein
MKASMYNKGGDGNRTGGISQLILSALDLVLQTLSFAPGGGNLGLHLLAAHIGHCVGRVTRGENNEEVGGRKIKKVEGKGREGAQ